MGIVNREGALYWATGIDNSGMYRDAQETQRIVKSLSESIKTAGIAMGAVFGVSTLAQFGREIINVRGEIQALESSFDVLLKGQGNLSEFIRDLKQFAIDSPLSMSGVSNAAQMLLAFGVEAKNVIPVIKQLGDISMGNEEKFRSLALAYAQMTSSGQVLSQDLRQMATAGFNPLGEIARTTGKTIQEVTKMMDDGAITVHQVADAFKSATSEGGKFHGMTQRQAEGIKGLRAQIEGSVQEMFNNIGKQSEGVITGVYKTTKSLIDNYETIGRTMMSLIATYGAYKAAVILVTTAEKGWTIASMAQYKWLLLVEKAQKLLNATMLKNPYVAVATAIVGLVTIIIALKDRTTDAQKAQERFNKVLEDAKKRKESYKSKTDELIAVLKDETSTIYQQVEAYKALQKALPDDLKGKTFAEVLSMSAEDLQKMANRKSEIDDKRGYQNQYEQKLKEIDAFRAAIKKRLDSDSKEDDKEIYGFRQALKNAILDADLLKKKLDDIADTEKKAFYAANPYAERGDLKLKKERLESEAKEIESRMNSKGKDDLSRFNDKLLLDSVNTQIQEIDKSLIAFDKSSEKATSKNKEYWEGVKKNAETALSKLSSDQYGRQEWKKLSDEISNADKELKKYNITSSQKDTSGKSQKISDELINIELSLSRERIAILKDGKKKRLKESEQEWKEHKAAINKEIDERKNKYKELGKSMPKYEADLFDSRLTNADKAKESRDYNIEKEYKELYKKQINEMTSVFLSDEEKKKKSIKDRYDNERKWAKEQLESGSITNVEYDLFMSEANKAEKHEQSERLLDGLNDFKAREKKINEQWDHKIAEASEAGNNELLQRLKEGKNNALGELNSQMLMQSDEWRMLFENMDTMTASQIQKLVGTIRSKAKDLKLDPANLEAIMKRLREAENQIRQKNPFKLLIKSIEDYRKAEKGAEKADSFRELAKNAESALGHIGSIFNSVADGLKQIGIAGDEETQKLLSNISSMIDGAANLAKGIASGNPADIISGSIKLLASAFEVFDNRTRSANRKIKKHADNLKQLQEEYAKLERATKRALGTGQYDKQLELNKNRQKQIAEIEAQIAAEQSKKRKKQDQGKINEWRNQVLQLKDDMQQTLDDVLNDLLTTDIKSFADSIASAIVQGVGEGTSDISSIVDKNLDDLMKNIITKQFNIRIIQEQLKPLLNYAETATKDGSLSPDEIKRIQRIGQDAKGAIVTGWEQWAQIMKEIGIETESIKNGVTGELKAAMTEQTGSQLVGLWNMTAMDIRELKEYLKSHPMPDNSKDFIEVLSELKAISKNTRDTADNTYDIKKQFDEMNNKLEDIKRNTKSNNSRA